jgi:tRNA threonylcarbamoyladenosine modification (KEOPS) complex  Pcc1 subunit
MHGKLILRMVNSRSDLRALYMAIDPDTKINPEGCRTTIEYNDMITLKIECERISLLRALTNSYLGIISMLLHVREELEDEPTKDPARGSAASNAIPGVERQLC